MRAWFWKGFIGFSVFLLSACVQICITPGSCTERVDQCQGGNDPAARLDGAQTFPQEPVSGDPGLLIPVTAPAVADVPAIPTPVFPTPHPVMAQQQPCQTQAVLPTQPVPAGIPIRSNGWEMTVRPELVILSDQEAWGIVVDITNTCASGQTFHFSNSGVTAVDDLGNSYELNYAAHILTVDCTEYYHSVKNLTINPGETRTIRADDFGRNACHLDNGISLFQGPISTRAGQVKIHFVNFGPFNNIDIVIQK